MDTAKVAFLAATVLIGVGSCVRGVMLDGRGGSTSGLSYTVTGAVTLFLDAVCAVRWSAF